MHRNGVKCRSDRKQGSWWRQSQLQSLFLIEKNHFGANFFTGQFAILSLLIDFKKFLKSKIISQSELKKALMYVCTDARTNTVALAKVLTAFFLRSL